MGGGPLKIPRVHCHPGLVLRIASSTLSTSVVSARASFVATTTVPRAITAIERANKESRIITYYGRIVEAAHAKHVPVISYDRLASAPVDLYVGFDLFSVGIEQAQSLVDRAPKGNYLLLGGSPLDANSKVVRAGQMKVLQPFIDRGDIHTFADVWVPEWSATEAYITVA